MLNGLTRGAQKKTSADLKLNEVRGLLILGGTPLHHRALAKGYCSATVHLAVCGKRRGPLSRRIVRELKEELGL